MRVLFEGYLVLFFAALYNTYSMTFDNATDYYANFVGFFWILILVALLVFVACFMASKQAWATDKFDMLTKEFKVGKRVLILDHIMFMARRILLSLIIVFGWNHGLIQTSIYIYFLICLNNSSIFLLWTIWIAITKALMRPYKNVILNIQDMLMEAITVMILSIFLWFCDPNDNFSTSFKANMLGWTLFALIVVIIAINYWFFLVISINKCIENRKKKRKMMYTVQPKETKQELSNSIKNKVVEAHFEQQSAVVSHKNVRLCIKNLILISTKLSSSFV